MKIAFLLDDSLDRTDGVQQYVLSLGQYFDSQGHEVYYLVGDTKRSDLKNVHSLSKNIRVKFNRNTLSIPLHSSTKRIKQLLDKTKFDVMHVQAPFSPLLSSKVIRMLPVDTCVIATFHILPFSTKEKYATKVLSKIVSKTNRRIDGFISVSKPAQEFAKRYYGIESEVIPNPVRRANHSKSKRINSKINIVFLGRLVERKGPLELLTTYYEILKNNPNTELNIYGDGPLKSKMIDYINSNDLGKNVILHGRIPESIKYSVLGDADIAVFPSKGGESFGIVLTEAISAGAAVVLGGDNPGYRSVLEYDETLFNPSNAQEFYSILNTYINDESLRQTTHIKQRELMKNYYIDVVGSKVGSFYKSVDRTKKSN